MRVARVKDRSQPRVYHVTSRIVGGLFLLDEYWKGRFIDLMGWLGEFCGVDLWTYALMSNHVHLMVGTPALSEVEALEDEELIRRVGVRYGQGSLEYKRLVEQREGFGVLSPGARAPWLRRMGDISMYMKDLKQIFSIHYNRGHERYGTLWAERFGSTMKPVEPGELRATAAYIDLNALRAGLVEDPKDYLYSGYGAAVRGDKRQQGWIGRVMEQESWEAAQQEYRQWLFVRGGFTRSSGKRTIPVERIRQVLEEKGVLEMPVASGGKKPCAAGEPRSEEVEVEEEPEDAAATRSLALGPREWIEALMGQFAQLRGARRKGPVKVKVMGEETWAPKGVRPRKLRGKKRSESKGRGEPSGEDG